MVLLIFFFVLGFSTPLYSNTGWTDNNFTSDMGFYENELSWKEALNLQNKNSPSMLLILDTISSVESPNDGYNSIHYSAKILPSKKPTDLSLSEIFTWIENTPNQNHAIGKYQFIPKTLRRLVEFENINSNVLFTDTIQDRLAIKLILDAGYNDFINGSLSIDRFSLNLSKIWAGLPTKQNKSYYSGIANNKSFISYSEFHNSLEKSRLRAH